MSRIALLGLLVVVYIALDFYVFNAIRLLLDAYSPQTRRVIKVIYFVISIGLFIGVIGYNRLDPKIFGSLRLVITSGFFIALIAKLFTAIFLFADDLRRGVTYLMSFIPTSSESPSNSRSEFMAKSALIAGTVPIAVFSFGILSGAHDYRVRKKTIYFELTMLTFFSSLCLYFDQKFLICYPT